MNKKIVEISEQFHIQRDIRHSIGIISVERKKSQMRRRGLWFPVAGIRGHKPAMGTFTSTTATQHLRKRACMETCVSTSVGKGKGHVTSDHMYPPSKSHTHTHSFIHRLVPTFRHLKCWPHSHGVLSCSSLNQQLKVSVRCLFPSDQALNHFKIYFCVSCSQEV